MWMKNRSFNEDQNSKSDHKRRTNYTDQLKHINKNIDPKCGRRYVAGGHKNLQTIGQIEKRATHRVIWVFVSTETLDKYNLWVGTWTRVQWNSSNQITFWTNTILEPLEIELWWFPHKGIRRCTRELTPIEWIIHLATDNLFQS
jgi:hypothetical protein